MLIACLLVLTCGLRPATANTRCALGWGDSSKLRDIPPSAVNDGYCDCPLDGKDEPGTDACSGSSDGGWAGIPASSGLALTHQCHAQPKLTLTLSRFNDGICDCCDGSDEQPGSCPDVCDEVLAEERAVRAKLEADFAVGSAKRRSETDEFEQMVQGVMSEIELESNTKLPQLEREVADLEASIKVAKDIFVNKRFEATEEVAQSMFHIGTVATVNEVVTFIQYVCQLHGELSDYSKNIRRSRNKNTCLPLRLAGLDLGFLWENEDFVKYSASFHRADEDASLWEQIADLLFNNWSDKETGDISIGMDDNATSAGKMRDEEEEYHATHHNYEDDDYEYEYDDSYDDDEYHHHKESGHELGKSFEHSGDAETAAVSEEAGIRGQSVRDAISMSPISKIRESFLSRATLLRDMIDGREKELGASDEEAMESGHSGTEEINPVAFKSSLDRIFKQIERGRTFATSAKVLLGALEDAGKDDPNLIKHNLVNLAIGVVYHSQLSAGDVSELFLMAMEDISTDLFADEESCSSIYMSLCPTPTIKRKSMLLPPEALILALNERCEERLVTSPDMNLGSDNEMTEIASNIPDGYSGYYQPQEYGENDVVRKLYAAMAVNDTVELDELKEKKDRVANNLAAAQKNISELEEKIGGRDEARYGADGELYGVRDSCHKIEAGKYEYEVCIFGGSKQRDKGQKSGGTSLGNWDGMERDKETGQRVMKWTGGTKCWNGPKRSVAVYVTCGSENKVLTADEAQTCEYVFTMESHIACDDDYKKEHAIDIRGIG